MLGALCGDFIGSSYEFKPIKSKEFELITPHSKFTDDSVLTCAVAAATLHYVQVFLPSNNFTHNEAAYKNLVTRYIQSWSLVYPFAGYGGKFRRWIESGASEPYGSFGNGSAMRVSSIGWIFNNLQDVELIAKWSAEVTHNTEEGIKGSQAIAGSIFLARTSDEKDVIKDYVTKLGYNLDRTLDDIRPSYKFDATCQGSVGEAVLCFLESNSIIDAYRNAVSLGGDADTQACMAGAIAEAYYDKSSEYLALCGSVFNYMDTTMKYTHYSFRDYLDHSNMRAQGLKC